ncbi:MAG: FHA domain-containing protein [Clostridiales bacterium]|nr:FHA domain-containing protein [Clostridiales bacterium]
MDEIMDIVTAVSHWAIPALGSAVLVYCSLSLLRHRFPSPDRAYLTEIKSGNVMPLKNWENAVGRSSACDIVANNDSVSRFHGVVARKKKGWTVIDTYSKTGIFVNGRRISSKTILENGDTVSFGGFAYKFGTDD